MEHQQTNHILSYEYLGTHWYITINDTMSDTQKDTINTILESYLESFARTYSRFRIDSIVAKLSHEGVIENPSQEVIDMLHFVLDIEEKSEGYFSILLADTLTSSGYGYHTGNNTIKDIVPLKNILHISPEKIVVDAGYKLDFGGFGKGWAVDAIATILEHHSIHNAIVNGGGDIRVLGKQTLILEDPMNTMKQIGEITISEGGVAASSPNRRKRVHDGKNHHHLINPYTKQSVDSPLLAVHTYAKNTLLADVASTILFVCPLEKIESIAQKLGVEYFLIFDDYSTVRSKGYPWKLIAE